MDRDRETEIERIVFNFWEGGAGYTESVTREMGEEERKRRERRGQVGEIFMIFNLKFTTIKSIMG